MTIRAAPPAISLELVSFNQDFLRWLTTQRQYQRIGLLYQRWRDLECPPLSEVINKWRGTMQTKDGDDNDNCN